MIGGATSLAEQWTRSQMAADKKSHSFMRKRQIWFDLLRFVVALLMAVGAVLSVLEYMGDRKVATAIAAAGFALCVVVYVWMSLKVGDIQRRTREANRNKTGDDDSWTDSR
jgi:hypothetical protein